MHLEVTILYKHDKTEKYRCVDFPGVGSDWITLYLCKDFERKLIPADGIAELSYKVVSSKK